MSKKSRELMTKAKAELVLEHPFFANLALRMEMREDAACRTAWSDGRTLAYNPAYIESLPLAKIKGLQCHEVLHVACGHHMHRNGRDKTLWNAACDYAINPVLLEAGIELPTGYLDSPAHHGKSADAIYARLADRDDESKGGAEGGPASVAQGQEETELTGQASAGSNDLEMDNKLGDTEEGESESKGDTSGGQGEDEGEEQGFDPGLSGEVRDAPINEDAGEGADDMQRHAEGLRQAVAQAVHKAREAGDMPGSLERLLGGLHAPGSNWRETLRRFMQDAARNDFSWVRPNRRHLHEGLYLPGLQNEELAQVALAVDVSGSITQCELDGFAAELSALLEEYDAVLTVMTCDVSVTSSQQLSKWDLPLELKVQGGGGTDFRPPFSLLEQEGISPACMVYFTDMECEFYPAAPDYPVLWITPKPNYAQPPFGDVVVMEASA